MGVQNDRSCRHIVVIVLGDIGLSPRMQYHALSCLEHGHRVTLVGYTGEKLIPMLRESDQRWRVDGHQNHDCQSRLKTIRMEVPVPPKFLRQYLQPIYLLLRLLGLVYSLTRTLFLIVPGAQIDTREKERLNIPVDCVVVQNPPSIPLLFLAYIFCLSRPLLLLPRPGLVIDWHNLGFTMFDISDMHPIRLCARIYERVMAPLASGHLCVTAALKSWLMSNFELHKHASSISVLRDRPPEFFRPTSPAEQHRLMVKIQRSFEIGAPDLLTKFGVPQKLSISSSSAACTLFTRITGGKAELRKDRPALVISSTSWTADEDFSVLLDACTKVEAVTFDSSANFPHVVVIVTGKGPQKAIYEEKISRLNLTRLSILTMWLEAEDYPVLLGCADLSVSLHTSTSGIDLPMKILDSFGCEVPVCAIDFACLDELVVDGKNGRVFRTAAELADQMTELLLNVGKNGSNRANGELEHLRQGIRGMTRWRENWEENAKDVILGACPVEGKGA